MGIDTLIDNILAILCAQVTASEFRERCPLESSKCTKLYSSIIILLNKLRCSPSVTQMYMTRVAMRHFFAILE